MAESKRLDKFVGVSLIHDLTEGGNYTHDEAFKLQVGFVYNLNLLKYERVMFKERYTYNYKLLTTQTNGTT